MASSLKDSLNKLSKAKVIKSMIKGYQRPLGAGGIKGLAPKKKKGYASDDDDPTPKKLTPIGTLTGSLPKIHLTGAAK